MASSGGRLSFHRYYGKKSCSYCKKKRARWYITCSPNFFELINARACSPCLHKCQECTAKNVPIKSKLDL